MVTWKTNTQINYETGNPCVRFLCSFLIKILTSSCHLKVFFLLSVSAVVLKSKIICISGYPSLEHVYECSQKWRLRGW